MNRSHAWLLATSIAMFAGCTSAAQDVCNQAAARVRRCMTSSECALMRAQSQCVAEGANLRPEYVNALAACHIDSIPCGTAGDSMLRDCEQNAMTAGLNATSYQNFARALCNACPTVASFAMGAPPTADECFQAATTTTAVSDAGALRASSFLTIFAIYSDAVLNPITTCAQAITPNTPTACNVASACMQGGTFSADAGPPCPTSSDAAIE